MRVSVFLLLLAAESLAIPSLRAAPYLQHRDLHRRGRRGRPVRKLELIKEIQTGLFDGAKIDQAEEKSRRISKKPLTGTGKSEPVRDGRDSASAVHSIDIDGYESEGSSSNSGFSSAVKCTSSPVRVYSSPSFSSSSISLSSLSSQNPSTGASPVTRPSGHDLALSALRTVDAERKASGEALSTAKWFMDRLPVPSVAPPMAEKPQAKATDTTRSSKKFDGSPISNFCLKFRSAKYFLNDSKCPDDSKCLNHSECWKDSFEFIIIYYIKHAKDGDSDSAKLRRQHNNKGLLVQTC